MAIGDKVRAYQAQKAAAAAADANEMSESTKPDTLETPTMAAVLAQIAAMQQQTAELLAQMKASGSGDTSVIEKQIEVMEALITKTRPENNDPPMISVFNPQGERDHPLPELTRKTIWAGHDVTKDTNLTRAERELLNRLQPGEYQVTKADGTRIPFKVRGVFSDRLDAQGKPIVAEINVWFPMNKEHRHNHLSMVSYCQQAMGEAIPTPQELLAEIAKLKAELAKRPQTVGVVA